MHVFLGLFILAFSSLAFEVALVRLLSVVTHYHLSFFAVSVAMLGLAAGGLSIYRRPESEVKAALAKLLTGACYKFALFAFLAVLGLCSLYILPLEEYRSSMLWAGLMALTGLCFCPFFYSGQAITLALTRTNYSIGHLYASDLIGASCGCLFVLWGLGILDAANFMLACAAGGAFAGVLFGGKELSGANKAFGLIFAVTLLLGGIASASSSWGIRPIVVKGNIEFPGYWELERWNTFSRVSVEPMKVTKPYLWGASPLTPATEIEQRFVTIDGMAGTPMHRMQQVADVEFLRYDVANVVYGLRKSGGACIIGVGGGRDAQAAVLAGHERVVGLDVNPLIIDLHVTTYGNFSGLFSHPGVELIADEARSYLARQNETFSVIQMSMIDTWASTASGAFSLTENGLYTVEAWRLFLSRLSPDGIFSVSRWHNPSRIGETGRAISLAMAALFEEGVTNPSAHLAMLSSNRLSTLLISRSPFSPEDIAELQQLAFNYKFRASILPGVPPANPIVQRLLAVPTIERLYELSATGTLNYYPPTDDSPYFFNMLKLSRITEAFKETKGVLTGNLMATLTLVGLIICLGILTIVTVLVPTIMHHGILGETGLLGAGRGVALGAVYFSAIGAGFMFLEIGLLQRLSLFLGHPVYALGILLFALILSTGIGSYVSERISLSGSYTVSILALVEAGIIVCLSLGMSVLISSGMSWPLALRALSTIAVVVPVGFVAGFFFPLGMRRFGQGASQECPWFWALNGAFGVLASALAVFLAIYWGVWLDFIIAALCYGIVAVVVAPKKSFHMG